MRTGMILKKIGMTQIYEQDGRQFPVTVLKNESCEIIATRTASKHGYNAVLVGAGAAKAKNTPKPQRVFYEKSNLPPKQAVAEFRVTKDEMADAGSRLSPAHFIAGQFVDATARSIGKGFAGVMKRHNFRGLRASHGVSVSHRSHGSTGQCQDPGKVFKGKKMAGHMGARQVTVQNLEIIKTDEKLGIVLVKGAVPGAPGSWVRLRDSVKHKTPKEAPRPAGLIGAGEKQAKEEASKQENKQEDKKQEDKEKVE